jgi:hypothetical protein
VIRIHRISCLALVAVLCSCVADPIGVDGGGEGGGAGGGAGGGTAGGSGGGSGGGAVDCTQPGTVKTLTPPTMATATSDFNVTLLDCTRTAVALACELGVSHKYVESVDAGLRSLVSNGIPNHDVGAFPNPGNPNKISAQNYAYKVPVTPAGTGATSTVFGIAFSGVVFDPGTAEVWNNNTTWRYEALRYATASTYFGSDTTMHPTALGVDCNFAHVQPTGAYHYHGVPASLVPTTPAISVIGWAGDGQLILGRWGYTTATDAQSALKELRSSYRLKTGARPTGGPGGNYDGTFGNDWEYVAGLGDLDECNGRTGVVTFEGVTSTRYYYVLTNTFPYIPRCFKSAPHASFAQGMMALMNCTTPGQMMCCGDGFCGGPKTHANCPADCP